MLSRVSLEWRGAGGVCWVVLQVATVAAAVAGTESTSHPENEAASPGCTLDSSTRCTRRPSIRAPWYARGPVGLHPPPSNRCSNGKYKVNQTLNTSGSICKYIDCSGYASPPKSVLVWNAFWRVERRVFGVGEGNAFARGGCRPSACFVTTDRWLAPPEAFDAVVVHALRLDPARDLPARRDPAQRYIFFLMEPPPQSNELREMDGVFNWTMTYRWDSDIVFPYGEVVALRGTPDPAGGWLQPPALPPDPEAAAALARPHLKRRKPFDGEVLVAWMASHCPTDSQREELVRRLEKHIRVDKYGLCGPLSWPPYDKWGFFAMLPKKYKFYLAFENSLCKDYATEKLFKSLGRAVPVVYGGANYSALLPPLSYIDARAFPSARRLARYLQFVGRRPREHAKFLWWTRHYAARPYSSSRLCNLCARLHAGGPPATLRHVREWWGGTCESPRLPA